MAASELLSQSDSNVNLPWTSISSRGSRPVTKLLAASCYHNYNEAVRAIRELGLRLQYTFRGVSRASDVARVV